MKEEYNHICKICGRKLKSEESKKLGMGKICYKKYIKRNKHKSLIKIR